jgi:hypothetical protein
MARLKTDDVEQLPSAEVPEKDSGKIVDERWFVEEYYPPHVDIAGNLIGEMWSRNYSEPFSTEKEANSWIAKHVPDYEDGKFRKAHEVLREVITTQWMPA